MVDAVTLMDSKGAEGIRLRFLASSSYFLKFRPPHTEIDYPNQTLDEQRQVIPGASSNIRCSKFDKSYAYCFAKTQHAITTSRIN